VKCAGSGAGGAGAEGERNTRGTVGELGGDATADIGGIGFDSNSVSTLEFRIFEYWNYLNFELGIRIPAAHFLNSCPCTLQ
jgi:hypothetical protein